MNILDRYLWRATLGGLLIAWLALVTLDLFFAFIIEVGKTGELYSTAQAAIYMIFTLPGRFYEFFPSAILIGALLGLGNLAAHSEFIAMRAAGISVRQIVLSVLKLGLMLVVGIFVMGEWLVPAADLHARNFKAHLKNRNITLTSDSGIWIKKQQRIIHIGRVLSPEQVIDVTIYTLNPDYSGLQTRQRIASASISNQQWRLKEVYTSTFLPMVVKKTFQPEQISNDFLDTRFLDIATVNPEQLSSGALQRIIRHQKKNQLNSDRYELMYWKRFSVPLSSLVMLILAMPFLFGSQRGGGTGQRVFLGIVLGITFFLVNRSINELGIVYEISPLVSAFLPTLLFFGAGFIALNRIR